jgi:hypothetical protein
MRKGIEDASKKDAPVFFQLASGHADISTYLKGLGGIAG